MELIVIRHGTTRGNRERRFIGLTDEPLAPEGETLARAAALRLPSVDHVYRSPLLRCKQTARLLWPDVEETEIAGLRETDFGPFEGKNHEELKDDPLYQRYISGGGTDIQGVERPEEAARRAVSGLRRLIADAKARGFTRAGVVTHGGTMMGLFAACGAPARPSFYDWMRGNCRGYRALVREDPLTLDVLEEL